MSIPNSQNAAAPMPSTPVQTAFGKQATALDRLSSLLATLESRLEATVCMPNGKEAANVSTMPPSGCAVESTIALHTGSLGRLCSRLESLLSNLRV